MTLELLYTWTVWGLKDQYSAILDPAVKYNTVGIEYTSPHSKNPAPRNFYTMTLTLHFIAHDILWLHLTKTEGVDLQLLIF